ncbi:MAG: DUF6198 family protein [Lachnospiraceae bacterium]|nr:DUF6198 family protein [Lachnospiraceae bacterium]
MSKKTFYTEVSYLLGVILLAFATALMARADFGLSMVVAPAYIVHVKIAEIASWFTFGMAEYCLQAVLLVLLGIILKRFRALYFFSFVTAVFYGIVLDLSNILVGFIPGDGIAVRIVFFVSGMVICAFSISLLFHTYIAPEAYELIVKEIAAKFNYNISKVKTIYDCTSCIISIILSFALFGFGKFVGINVGTIVCALLNGVIIGFFSKVLEKHYNFKDCFKFADKFK